MDKWKKNHGWLYIVVFIVSLLPLFCGYLSNADGVTEWLNIAKVVLIQGVALCSSIMMFGALWQNSLSVLMGVTLYMMSPYRIDLFYVQGDWKLSAVWALVPLYFCFIMRCVKETAGKKKVLCIAFAAVVMAAIGYGSDVMFCILAAFTLFLAVFLKKVSALLPTVGGCVLWLPGNVDFFLYLFTNRLDDVGMPIQNIISGGYTWNDFLTCFAYHGGKPGLGLGIIVMAAVFTYVRFVNGGAKLNRESRVFGWLGILSLFMATKYFPWEMVQRVGAFSLKFVSLLETPALFAGFAALLLPVALVSAVEDVDAAKEHLPARGALVLIWTAAVGTAIYLCNMLTYTPPVP